MTEPHMLPGFKEYPRMFYGPNGQTYIVQKKGDTVPEGFVEDQNAVGKSTQETAPTLANMKRADVITALDHYKIEYNKNSDTPTLKQLLETSMRQRYVAKLAANGIQFDANAPLEDLDRLVAQHKLEIA